MAASLPRRDRNLMTGGNRRQPRGNRMQLHHVKVHPSKAELKREDQLAWKIAGSPPTGGGARRRRR